MTVLCGFKRLIYHMTAVLYVLQSCLLLQFSDWSDCFSFPLLPLSREQWRKTSEVKCGLDFTQWTVINSFKIRSETLVAMLDLQAVVWSYIRLSFKRLYMNLQMEVVFLFWRRGHTQKQSVPWRGFNSWIYSDYDSIYWWSPVKRASYVNYTDQQCFPTFFL